MRTLILVSILFFSLNAYSQVLSDININCFRDSQAKFIGGEDALNKFFGLNLQYTKDMSYGTMIGVIIIDQYNKEYKTLMINSLGKSCDNEFNRVVQLTKHKWEKNDSINTLYCVINIEFSYAGSKYFIDYQGQPDFIIGGIQLKIYIDKKIKSDEKLVATVNKYYSEKNYKKALPIINQLIKRNPYYSTFYVMRIKSLLSLGKDATKDYWVLTEFLNERKYIDILNNE